MGAVSKLIIAKLYATIVKRKVNEMPEKYLIRKISARALINNARPTEDGYRFMFSEEATKRVTDFSKPIVQDDCPLFHQIVCQLKEDGNYYDSLDETNSQLLDVLLFVDFSGIFDHPANQSKYQNLQEKAKLMFSPDGIELDFGYGYYKYLAFERSNSMSRNSQMSFIREDLYESVHKRITLGMDIGMCQLSKLYAYNGLMLTSSKRIPDDIIWDPKKIVVVDNPKDSVPYTDIITVQGGEKKGSFRSYSRVNTIADVEIMQFDGEGLVSKEYSNSIDSYIANGDKHSSYQIRMPYIKGVVHEVDFKSLFHEIGVEYIIDIWGERHPIDEVELILTKSMFKGFGWMTENNMSWEQYLDKCCEYDHALYISGVNQTMVNQYVELNYQFLNTADIKDDEFRPKDLPKGWSVSPETDEREWLTKATETEYYNLVADEEAMINHFAGVLYAENPDLNDMSRADLLVRNPLFLNEPLFKNELLDKAKKVLKNYSLGRLKVLGDNRYLSDDLMSLIHSMVSKVNYIDGGYDALCVYLIKNECYNSTVAYIPNAAYPENEFYTLLRNPHIARNEEAIVSPPDYEGSLRNRYMSHLNYVVMVDSRTLIPERLGGADYDGDMVKIIADPLVNKCIRRNYGEDIKDQFSYKYNIPLIKIPSEQPEIKDAKDWEARYETVKNTFSSRVGQICNAAFNRSVIAYDENSTDERKQRYKEETEILEILTGLEIDSAKSGIKPDLSQYLNKKEVSRSIFLKYKTILDEEEKRQWYEPTMKAKLNKFFSSVDWDNVTSNVERLPLLAKELQENTPVIFEKAASDEELFTFAKDPSWKDKLDPKTMEITKKAIDEYETAVKRIQIGKLQIEDMKRKGDIERILYSRGQEDDFSADELYAIFKDYDLKRISYIRNSLTKKQWHLMNLEERKNFLLYVIPFNYDEEKYYNLFSDFRCGGYRLLGDIICDIDDKLRAEELKERLLKSTRDQGLIYVIMSEYKINPDNPNWKENAGKHLYRFLRDHTNLREAVKCAVALNKRNLMIEIAPCYLLEYVAQRR